MGTAYLWCPAFPLTSTEQLVQCRERACAFARASGLTVVESALLSRLGARGSWFPAAKRQADLAQGLGHDLLLAARGGYGCIDLLPVLAEAGQRRQRLPLLVGYSDLTVLHAWWRQHGGRSIYGFMPAVPSAERALESASALVRGEDLSCDQASLPGVIALRSGQASGPLFAGCLRVLTALVGTPVMPALAGCILALEDIDEPPYRIERDLTQLHAAGALAGVRGLVFGTFPCAAQTDYGGPSTVDLLRDWAERLGVPALAGLPIGHDADPLALPCPTAAPASIQVTDRRWHLQLPGLPRDGSTPTS